jgi:hypothetical protein
MKILVAFFALMLACSAAEVAGIWKLTTSGRDGGEGSFTLVIKQDGANYSGTISNDEGAIEISNVKLSGDQLTFKVITDDASYEVTGAVDGDSMKGKFTVNQQQGGAFTAKRQKK